MCFVYAIRQASAMPIGTVIILSQYQKLIKGYRFCVKFCIKIGMMINIFQKLVSTKAPSRRVMASVIEGTRAATTVA